MLVMEVRGFGFQDGGSGASRILFSRRSFCGGGFWGQAGVIAAGDAVVREDKSDVVPGTAAAAAAVSNDDDGDDDDDNESYSGQVVGL